MSELSSRGGDTGHLEQRPVEQRPEFAVLDTLRAVGAIAVLTTHTTFQSGEYLEHGVWGSVLARLDIGVAIFFVLSGFLLGRPYLARATLSQSPRTGRYYWKRLLRIYPAYAVTVVLALALVDQERSLGLVDWMRSLLLLDSYTQPLLPQGLTQMWSLAVEVAFYVVLPLLMLLALGRRPALRVARLSALLLGLVAISVLWHLSVGPRIEDRTDGVAMTWLPAYLGWFAVGLALALAHVHFQRSPGSRAEGWLRTLGRQPGTCWVAAGGLFLACATPLAGATLLYRATPAESLTKNLLYGLIAGLIVLTGIFTVPSSRYVSVMSLAPLRHLGHISYSLFCLHLPVLQLVMVVGDFELFGGRGLELWAITAAISLLAAELLYRAVERPFLRLKNLPPPWRRPRSGAAATNGTRAAANAQ